MWPFSKKWKDLSTLFEEEHQWGMAELDEEQGPLLIRFNSTVKDWEGHPELPIKLGFAIPLNNPNEGGLPDPDENEQLSVVEDAICREVEQGATGVQVLALTTGIMKEFIFYISPGADIAKMHQTLQENVSSHEVQCIAITEPKWDLYKSFSPR